MDVCPLTGKKIKLIQPNPSVQEFFYETQMTGKVFISDIAFRSAGSLNEEEKRILVGICRNKTLRKEPFGITYALFNQLKISPFLIRLKKRSITFYNICMIMVGRNIKAMTLIQKWMRR